jgi:hypothetical protein
VELGQITPTSYFSLQGAEKKLFYYFCTLFFVELNLFQSAENQEYSNHRPR